MTTVFSRFVRRRAAWLTVLLAVLSVSVTLQAAMTCSPRIFNRVKTTGNAAQKADFHKALVRLERIKSRIDPQTWDRLGLDCLDVADPNAVTQVTIHHLVKVTNNTSVTDPELAAVLRAWDRLRRPPKPGEKRPPQLIGIITKSGSGDDSSAWILAVNNRGHLFELPAADHLIRNGEVNLAAIEGFGFRLKDANGLHLLEGDLVDRLPSGLLRYFDFKADGGDFTLEHLDRVYEAIKDGHIGKFVFVYESGGRLPSAAWIDKLNDLNRLLAPDNTQPSQAPIRLLSGGTFP